MKDIRRYIRTMAPEMQERMMECGTVEEMMRLARTEGLELPDEALDAVYGGCSSYTYKVDDYMRCKECKTRVNLRSVGHDGFPDVYFCPTCYTTKDGNEVEHYYNRYKTKK